MGAEAGWLTILPILCTSENLDLMEYSDLPLISMSAETSTTYLLFQIVVGLKNPGVSVCQSAFRFRCC